MRTRRSDSFTTITIAGQVLPADLLQRIADKDKELGGLGADSYHLGPSETISEATSRSWNKLIAAWANFTSARSRLPANDPGTTVTRERWLLPLFQELGYGRLPPSRSVEIDGKGYAISHWWGSVSIHLVGVGVSIDKLSPRIPGAARSSPHSLVQELLNRSEESLWGFVSNGSQLRILRDNQNLVRQAYVEFDLEAMMDGEAYSDFVMLWLLCHQSRVEAEKPKDYWLEKWSRAAQERGVRALEHLREGVEEAISLLGSGFLAHRANANLRDKLRSGLLDKQDYYRQLLRLVYRLLFLFVAEDRTDEKNRSLLLDPNASQEACDLYLKFYSTKKLRELAGRRHGSRHSDLYAGIRLVMEKLGSDGGCAELALPALGSFLFSQNAIADLNEGEIANHDLLDAVRALAFASYNQARRQIDYKNLGSEELGSVYESLLELHPQLNIDAGTFALSTAAGHERKTTGSYYTHDSLVQCLLDSALDPVLNDRERGYAELGYKSKEEAILDLKVCDPACGSGHFLIAAAHRIAKRLAASRTGNNEPSPEATRHALRDVVSRSLYGVDINPMSVELCKVSLWMEAVEPGKPLSFLDYHIQQGNSLLGTTPALMEAGIPDDAFKTIEGDEREYCSEYKRRNRDERKGFKRLEYEQREPWERLGNVVAGLMELEAIDDEEIDGVREQERRYAELVNSSDYRFNGLLLADAWCASFVWKKRKDPELPYPITEEEYRSIEKNPFTVANSWMENEILRLARQYQFFHWHLRFPTVFRLPAHREQAQNVHAGWVGGFDVVLGNPPWERIKLQEREWFAERRPDIANAPNAAARAQMIASLAEADPTLYEAFLEARRASEGESHLVRDSGRYPLCGRGDINTYAIFAEDMRSIINPLGRVGSIVPSGIATDDTTKFFFQDLTDSSTLVSLYDFENSVGLFPGVGHGRQKFCLLTITGDKASSRTGAEFVWFAKYTDDLKEERRRYKLRSEEILLLNPNTRTSPIFRSKRDAELTKAIYRRVPVLFNETATIDNAWRVSFVRMFDMSNASHLFRTREQLEAEGWQLVGNFFRRGAIDMQPLYEAKMLHQFNHRFGDYADYPEGALTSHLPDIPSTRLIDPFYGVLPRYWIDAQAALRRLASVPDGLLDAVHDQNEEVVSQLLRIWFAGALLVAGEREAGTHHLHQSFNVIPQMIPLEETTEWNAAITMAREFPLQPDEVRSEGQIVDLVQTAERLIDARMPRWLLGWRKTCRSTDERTVISSLLPAFGVNDKYQLIRLRPNVTRQSAYLISNLNSLVFDYCARQKLGGTDLSYFVFKQLPVLPSDSYSQPCEWEACEEYDPQPMTLANWLLPRVIELTYTAWDLEAFAQDCEWSGPPFRWNDERRFLLRCELDAGFFHLYGISHEDAAYILDTFPILKRKDEVKYNGDYRTKRVILEIYDEMAHAIATGAAYQTRLDPPPADPAVAHPPRVQPVPLVLPSATRYPQPDHGVYMMRVILSMLQESGGSIDVESLMNACSLLASPDALETYGARIEPGLANKWRRRFSDQFRAELFLAKLDDLVQRGEIRLVREADSFKASRISTSTLITDPDIEFDARFALKVGASLARAETEAFPPMATREEIEARSSLAA
ncbi:MAG TPA: N-6 DNA methylase [Pyrinomonadaceae bacterium]|nr:N-6 DNA methylase [Pyrinomonadaceae bacterium]